MTSRKDERGIVLIRRKAWHEAYVIKEFRKIEQVTEIQGIIGEHDLLVKLDVSSGSEECEIANKKILDVDKVRSIESLGIYGKDFVMFCWYLPRYIKK